MSEGKVTANGIEFAYLEAGEGPLVLLLHGFPDDAHTWSAQLDALAGAGYRAVAPFMRGYPPTAAVADGRYDAEALAGDVAALAQELGDGPVYLVGHDWGAIATYAAMALHSDSIERAVVIAVGHPRTFTDVATTPRFAHHAFHTWLFQLGDFALAALEANDMALVDYLWQLWSPNLDDSEHVARVKSETLAAPGAAAAALSYYPALLNLPRDNPEAAQRLLGETTVPTLAIFGGSDPLLPGGGGEYFTAPYRQVEVAGTGHFVHRERPDEVNRLLLEWIGAGGAQPNVIAPTRSE
jgi:pimeloyl-ACP methyl ester carboxylesterase